MLSHTPLSTRIPVTLGWCQGKGRSLFVLGSHGRHTIALCRGFSSSAPLSVNSEGPRRGTNRTIREGLSQATPTWFATYHVPGGRLPGCVLNKFVLALWNDWTNEWMNPIKQTQSVLTLIAHEWGRRLNLSRSDFFPGFRCFCFDPQCFDNYKRQRNDNVTILPSFPFLSIFNHQMIKSCAKSAEWEWFPPAFIQPIWRGTGMYGKQARPHEAPSLDGERWGNQQWNWLGWGQCSLASHFFWAMWKSGMIVHSSSQTARASDQKNYNRQISTVFHTNFLIRIDAYILCII